MIVCVCHRISDKEIVRHAHAGMSFDEIQFELGVATQCGNCETCAREVVKQCSALQPVAAINQEPTCGSNQPANNCPGVQPWNLLPHSSPA